MMSIDEAIQHCEEKTDCTECGQEHEQLVRWLKELKELKDRDESKLCKNIKTVNDFHNRIMYLMGDCPRCGHEDIKSCQTNFCYICGQRLRWM